MDAEIAGKLGEALRRIDRPGSFCASGSLPGILPGLEVEGLGSVGLPLTAGQAKELKKLCDPPPAAKKGKASDEKAGRRAWRLEPGRFSVRNPDWQLSLGEMIATVGREFGLEVQGLQGQLRDLLLFEAGGSSPPRAGSEGPDRAVATLVVVLPSAHEGGELVVRHEGQERTLDFARAENPTFRVHFAAFYADCEYEVRPVREGHCLSLVYDLTLGKSRKVVGAPRGSVHIEQLAGLVRGWTASHPDRKLAVLLGPSPAGESTAWESLAGIERARALALVEAAGRVGCKAYLGRLTFWQSGSAEYSGGGGYGYGYGRRRWDDDDEDEDGRDSGRYEMGEVYDSRLMADEWIDREGRRLPIDETAVRMDEILDAQSLTDVEPEEKFGAYAGHGGTTLQRWYRHAAIFIWPESRHIAILCSQDTRRVVPLFREMVAGWRASGGEDAGRLRSEAVELASAILARWPGRNGHQGRPGAGAPAEAAGEDPTADLLEALAALEEPRLIREVFEGVMVKDAGVDPGESIVAVCRDAGWGTYQPQLVALMRATTRDTLARNAGLLEHICLAKPREKKEWGALCKALATALMSATVAIDGGPPVADWPRREPSRAGIVVSIVRALTASGQPEALSDFVQHVLATPRVYPLRETNLAAVEGLRTWLTRNVKKPLPPLRAWLSSVREQFESITARAPIPPADYRHPAPILCKCDDCGELMRFLENPREIVYRFVYRQDRRSHLEAKIRESGYDLDLLTDRRESPHTLVCTKNATSFEVRLRQHHEDLERLRAIRAVEEALP